MYYKYSEDNNKNNQNNQTLERLSESGKNVGLYLREDFRMAIVDVDFL